MIKSYADLLVWQEAMRLAEQVYRATKRFPKDELYGLTSQMRRASVSVPSNIAEGQARDTRPAFLQFLGVARASLAELHTQTLLARRLDLLPHGDEQTLCGQIERVGKLLSGLRRSLTPKPDSSDH